MIQFIRPLVLSLLVLACFTASGSAQETGTEEVPIPDPGLNAAVREALQKPTGLLTEQDLLSLTILNASQRNVQPPTNSAVPPSPTCKPTSRRGSFIALADSEAIQHF